MNEQAQELIRLDNVTKIFYTDEVETHALSGIQMEIRAGEYISMSGPSGCGKSDPAVDPWLARHAERGYILAQREARCQT